MKMLMINPAKCNGCRLCEYGCSLKFTGKFNPARARIHVTVLDETFALPLACTQCDGAYCLKSCPIGAITLDRNTGAIKISNAQCVGCKICLFACPFGNMAFSHETGTAVKCELCDGNPECVALCPTGALVFAEADKDAMAKQRDIAAELHIIMVPAPGEASTERPAAQPTTKLYEGAEE